MEKAINELMKLLKEKHGKDLDLKSGEVHYLFFKDGLFNIYLEEDTKTLKVDVQFLDEGKVFVYHSDKSINDVTGIGKGE